MPFRSTLLSLFSISRTAHSLPKWEKCEGFAINVLTQKQARLSAKFATALSDKGRDVQFDRGLGGAPILADVAASFQCHPFARHDSGGHLPFIARVVRFSMEPKHLPLVHCMGNTTNLRTVRADGSGLIFGAWAVPTRANDVSSPSLDAPAVEGPDVEASRACGQAGSFVPHAPRGCAGRMHDCDRGFRTWKFAPPILSNWMRIMAHMAHVGASQAREFGLIHDGTR